jgi:hypothetical protein
MVQRSGQFESTSHQVRSISECGVSINGADRFMVGETLNVRVGDRIAVSATVRWVGNGAADLSFAEPIDVTRLVV